MVHADSHFPDVKIGLLMLCCYVGFYVNSAAITGVRLHVENGQVNINIMIM